MTRTGRSYPTLGAPSSNHAPSPTPATTPSEPRPALTVHRWAGLGTAGPRPYFSPGLTRQIAAAQALNKGMNSMQYSRLRNLFGLLAVFAVVSGACNSPNSDPTSPTLQDPATGAFDSVANGGPPGDRFDGNVTSVNAAGQSFQLGDGTLVRVTATTEWKQSGPRLGSLAALADAVMSGMDVRAKGDGQADAGGAIVAERVDARVEGGVASERFDSLVTGANDVAMTMDLQDGTMVATNAATRWKTGPGRLTSLTAVASAVTSGLTVRAKGTGMAQAGGSILATALDVRVSQASTRNFRGNATAVDTFLETMTLGPDTVVLVTDATSWKRGPNRLTSLEQLETALLSGAVVYVKGKGTTNTDGLIAELDVRLQSDALIGFSGEVLSVDEVTGTLFLADGTMIVTFDATRWKQGGRWLSSPEAVMGALDAGERVRAAGKGTLMTDGSFLAAVVRAKVKPGDDEDGDEDDDLVERRR